jgi:hypothetical protein
VRFTSSRARVPVVERQPLDHHFPIADRERRQILLARALRWFGERLRQTLHGDVRLLEVPVGDRDPLEDGGQEPEERVEGE